MESLERPVGALMALHFLYSTIIGTCATKLYCLLPATMFDAISLSVPLPTLVSHHNRQPVGCIGWDGWRRQNCAKAVTNDVLLAGWSPTNFPRSARSDRKAYWEYWSVRSRRHAVTCREVERFVSLPLIVKLLPCASEMSTSVGDWNLCRKQS